MCFKSKNENVLESICMEEDSEWELDETTVRTSERSLQVAATTAVTAVATRETNQKFIFTRREFWPFGPSRQESNIGAQTQNMLICTRLKGSHQAINLYSSTTFADRLCGRCAKAAVREFGGNDIEMYQERNTRNHGHQRAPEQQ